MTAEAFRQIFGSFSESFSAAATLLFAFATVVGWSCCGERSVAYLLGEGATVWYRVLYVALIIPGCVMNTGAVWAASDIFNALLMLPNLAVVILLWSREQKQGQRAGAGTMLMAKSSRTSNIRAQYYNLYNE